MKKLALAMILMVLLSGACTQLYPSGGVASASMPVITSFTANPSIITLGQSATLTWNVTGATSVGIQPDIGGVALSGSLAVTPASTTAYTLTATSAYGSATSTVTVTVNPSAAPPVASSFTVSPAVITPGQSATLSWSVTGADSVRIDPSVGNVPASGSQQVSPSSTTTYMLTASNSAGIITDSTTLSVTTYLSPGSTYFGYPVYPAPYVTGMPVIVSFAAYPPVITYGESSTLSWDVSGADTVSIDQGVGEVPLTGSMVVTPINTTYFTLTATNSSGSNYASALVTVYPSNSYPTYPYMYPFQYPTFPIIPRPHEPPPPPHYRPPSGSDNETGKQGTGNRDHRGMLPRINYFNSSPTNTDVGQSAELRWNVNGATSISINHGVGDIPPSGTKTVIPNHTMIYTITASNSTGVVQHSQEIVVPRTLNTKKPNQTGGH